MDKKEALKQIKAGDFSLEDADKKLKADKEVVLAVIKQDGHALEYASKKLKADKKFILDVVKQSGWTLEYADNSLKKDKQIVLEAIKQYGGALEFADDSFKKDREIVLEAVKNSSHAIDFADDSFKEDKEIMLVVIKRKLALYYADENSQKDPDILAIINKEQTSDKERDKLLEAFEFLVQQIAKGLKEAFDDNEDIALDYAIPSKENFELVITRDSEGENGQYNITLDLHEDESDDYEQIAYSGGGSELSDFEGIIQDFIANGGRIEELFTYFVKEKK